MYEVAHARTHHGGEYQLCGTGVITLRFLWLAHAALYKKRVTLLPYAQ
jgi:hypothetical protein